MLADGRSVLDVYLDSPSRRDEWVLVLAPLAAGVTSWYCLFYLNLVVVLLYSSVGVHSAAAMLSQMTILSLSP